jgi:hypothetical protein
MGKRQERCVTGHFDLLGCCCIGEAVSAAEIYIAVLKPVFGETPPYPFSTFLLFTIWCCQSRGLLCTYYETISQLKFSSVLITTAASTNPALHS